MRKHIVEKELGIPADYQYKAIRSSNFIQSNWHKNKMFVVNLLSHLNKNMKVLDLGTGSGNFELLFHSRVKKIVGVDYNDEALEFLKGRLESRKIKNVTLENADLRNFKLSKNQSFDLIIMIDVIEHLDYDDVKSLFTRFKKYLNKNGKVIIVTPNYKSLWPLLEYAFDYLGLAPKFREHQHLSKLYKSNLVELIAKNKFKLEKVCTFNLFSYLIPNSKLSEKFCLMETKIPVPAGNLITVVFSNS